MNPLPILDQAIADVAEQILEGLLGGAPDQTDIASDTGSLTTPVTWLRCAIRIDGEWHGQVIVRAPRAFASWAAGRMFGSAAADPIGTEDAQDALREIANIIAGHVKPLLGEGNSLGLPRDEADDRSAPPGATKRAEVMVTHGDELLEVQVFQGA